MERSLSRRMYSTAAFRAALTLGAAGATGGCGNASELLDMLLNPPGRPQPDIAITAPSSNQTLNVGATISVRWADLAYEPGTIVAVDALQLSASSDDVVDVMPVETARDAFADGDGDLLEIDSTNVAPGRYRYRVTISSPDGFSDFEISTGIVTLQ